MKVTYLDHMGDDLSVVNAAKVSFGKKSDWDRRLDHYSEDNDTGQWEAEGWEFWCDSTSGDVYRRLSDKDKSLIQFLARGCTTGEWENLMWDTVRMGCVVERYDCHETIDDVGPLLNHIRRMPSHWSPFAHTAISLHLKMPIFVARQIMKHTTGIEYNEVSRRYVDSEPEFYEPKVWRKKADNVKQGSSDEAMPDPDILDYIMESIENLYSDMIFEGYAPEQARMILPQSMYTEVIMTGNLYAIANLYNQRIDPHAQKETQEIARQIGEIVEPLYPVSWAALTE